MFQGFALGIEGVLAPVAETQPFRCRRESSRVSARRSKRASRRCFDNSQSSIKSWIAFGVIDTLCYVQTNSGWSGCRPDGGVLMEMPGRELSGKPLRWCCSNVEKAARAQLLSRRILVKTQGSTISQKKGKVSGRAKKSDRKYKDVPE